MAKMTKEEKLVSAIMNNDALKANEQLEAILQEKAAKKMKKTFDELSK